MWSTVEAMTGNPINKNLRSRLGEPIDRLRSAAFGRCQNKRKTAEKVASLRKVTLQFLLETSSG
jgi:hypothetical protein